MTWHSKVQLGLFLSPLSYCPVITFILPLPRLSLSPYPPAHGPQTRVYPKSVIRLGRPPTKWVTWTLLPSSLSSFRRHRHRSANLPLPPQMACQLEITAHKFCCSLRCYSIFIDRQHRSALQHSRRPADCSTPSCAWALVMAVPLPAIILGVGSTIDKQKRGNVIIPVLEDTKGW